MKRLLTLLLVFTCTLSFAQDLKTRWATVAQFEEEGNFKKAAALTEEIYLQVKKEKNEPQLVKTFLFRAKYILRLEEEGVKKVTDNLQQEIKNASPVTRALLQNIYASILADYLKRNSWKINPRKPVTKPADGSILTWAEKDFKQAIDSAYAASLRPEKALLQTPLTAYEEIIDFSPVLSKVNRPVYDFLAEKYIEYYRWTNFTSEKQIPALESLYSDTPEFLKIQSDQKKLNTLVLLQKLEQHYLNTGNTYALQMAHLRRIRSIKGLYYDHPGVPDEIKALTDYIEKWGETAFTLRAKYYQASFYHSAASKNQNPEYRIKALSIAREIVNSKIPNDVTLEAEHIISNITTITTQLKTEKYTAPNRPWLGHVTFANTDSIRVRLYKIPVSRAKLSFSRSEVEKYPLAAERIYALPARNDYFEYTTEVVLPPVPMGAYLIIAEPASIEDGNNTTNWPVVYATHLTLTERNENNKILYTIYNRDNGAPIKGASVAGKKTNDQGVVTFPAETDSGSYTQTELVFAHAQDTITTTMYQSRRSDVYKPQPLAVAVLYLDRAIYRPGQIVFYKGILYKNDPIKKTKEVVANAFLTMEASGPSGQITTTSIKTNKYGSFSGEFKLPMGQTGVFEIQVDNDDDNEADPLYKNDEHAFWDDVEFNRAETHFRVEEYKRPTFDISFNKVKEAFKLGDTIRVSGTAKSFSTAPVAGAKVRYNIVRSEYRPYYTNASFYDDEMRENDLDDILGNHVDDGETVTDENGNFTIRFESENEDNDYDDDDEEADPKRRKRKHIKYYYTVMADITDVNGETRRQITEFNVGNYLLELTLDIEGTLHANDSNTIKADSRNANGIFTPSKGTVTIYRKSSVGRPMVARPWEAPEIQTIPEAEFVQQFPYYPYTLVKDSVIKSKVWFKKDFTTTKETTLRLGNMKNWPSGDYVAYYTAKDSTGYVEEVSAEFVLQNSSARENGGRQFQISVKDGDYRKNGYATLQIATLMNGQYVLLRGASGSQGLIFEKGVTLTKGLNIVKVPISKTEYSDINVAANYILENNCFTENISIPAQQIILPESLNINVERLSGIMAPGGSQNIKINLSPKSKRAEAELLASMYDASLDRFVQQAWRPIYNNYYNYNYRGWMPDVRLKTYGNSATYYSFSQEIRATAVKQVDDYYTYGFSFNLTNKPNTPQYTQPKGQAPQPGDFLVTGTVTDDKGMAIPAATVTISGSAEGVQTDFDGNFAIYVAKGEHIQIAFIGFQTIILVPSGSGVHNITLQEDANELQDVVVVGYGVERRQNLTAAATTIVTSKTIEGRPNANFIQTLQGQVPGLTIVTGNGAPGANTVEKKGPAPLVIIDGEIFKSGQTYTLNENDIADLKELDAKEAEKIYGAAGKNGAVIITTKKSLQDVKKVTTRKNFNETAFFYPMLYPDKKGNISLNVTVPESLTEWKLRLLAHNKNAETAYAEKKIITRKELMVVPNMPRFLRETDTLTIKVKITNLTDNPKTGTALLQLYDAVTLAEADAAMGNVKAAQSFSIGGNANTVLSWTITVPKGLQGVQYKVLAKSGDYSDGEENILPVLPNSMLLTESIPLWVREHSTREYTFENLKNNTSTTLRNQSLVLEYTSNPAWLALQSLPYLMQYEHDCTEQLFSKFFAQSIARHIMAGNPKIKAVFDKWRSEGKPSRMDNDPQLRNTLLAETPWLLEMENKAERDYRLSVLMDLDKIASAKQDILEKLKLRRLPSGVFPWFPGGVASPYISRYVVQSLGHLYHLNALTSYDKTQTDQFIKPAIDCMDMEFIKNHQRLLKPKNKTQRAVYPRYDDLHYLYARSYFIKEFPVSDSLKKYIMPLLKWQQQNWKNEGVYGKALAALVFHRFGYQAEAEKILAYLKGSSSNNTDWGMYWISNDYGWYWYNNPIETHTLAIEAFDEITHDRQAVDNLKIWLLKQKQNTHWPTTKGTSEAIYALLATGSNFLDKKDETKFSIGDEAQLNKKIAETATEAASGYMKIQWKPEEISSANATLKIENKGDVPGFGGFYWQYFEQLDKIKPAQDGLMNISKELFHKEIIDGKTTLTPITATTPLKTGQSVMVRMELYLKEDAEFVHLKDMRASGFEPVDVLSGYRYKDGLSYYQSTRDVATHFFFNYIPRGTYVLEYELKVNNPGQFSNGITTLQSMYAPEFSGHTSGTRVHITE